MVEGATQSSRHAPRAVRLRYSSATSRYGAGTLPTALETAGRFDFLEGFDPALTLPVMICKS